MNPPSAASILRRNLKVWLALLALLGLTLGLAYVRLGSYGNTVVALSIGAAKAGLVALLFMELRERESLPRLAAVAALLWLAILFTLALADFIARLPLQALHFG